MCVESQGDYIKVNQVSSTPGMAVPPPLKDSYFSKRPRMVSEDLNLNLNAAKQLASFENKILRRIFVATNQITFEGKDLIDTQKTCLETLNGIFYKDRQIEIN